MITDIQITLNQECTVDVQARLNYFKNHAAMENLDFAHSGHTGFASETYVNTKIAALNAQNGTGTNAIQMKSDGGITTFDFTNKNPNATELDPTLTGNITYGATGNYATVFGGKNAAMGKRALAEGTTTIAKANYSHAEGDNSVTLGSDSHAEGLQTTSYGQASHSEGRNTVAKGTNSHSEGNATKAEGDSAHSEGYNSQAKGNYSHTEGSNTQVNEGCESAHAEGGSNIASAVYSHAEGYGTQAGTVKSSSSSGSSSEASSIGSSTPAIDIVGTDGYASHAEGYFTNAYGAASHSEGSGTVASGPRAHAEGYSTIASGENSHAEGGDGNRALSKNSHVGGVNSYAGVENGFVHGENLQQGTGWHKNQVILGQNNSVSNSENELFVIGNGSNANNRSNAFSVSADGTAKVGAMGTATLSVTTKGYVDDKLSNKADLVNGTIPSSQLPSYVDDVIDFEKQVTGSDFMSQILATDLGTMVWIAANKSYTGETYYRKFAINNDGTESGLTLVLPESGKIYVGKTDTNCYRWSGSNLIEISKSLALGETASTAYAGNKGKANADAIAAIKNGTTMNDFASVEAAIHAIVNIYYPVGSIYLSVVSTNPGTLFGGTWEQIKDKFLLSAGDNHSAGSTGGSEDAVVVSHTHSFSATSSENGSHSHTGISRKGLNGSSYNGLIKGTAYNGGLTEEVDPYAYTSTDGNHTHSVSGTTESSGESGTGKNMPPYLTVYMWKRTA